MLILKNLSLLLLITIITSANPIKEAKSSLVRLGIYNGDELISTGSSFPISKDIFVTNFHVIEDSKFSKDYKTKALVGVINGSYQTIETKLLVSDEKRDLAIIQIIGLDKRPLNLLLGLEDSEIRYSISDRVVYSIGFPSSSDMMQDGKITQNNIIPTSKRGIISKFTKFVIDSNSNREIAMIETDATVNGGNSGGPLIDECGRVVGINEMKIISSDIDNVYYAIRVDELIALLDESGIDYNKESGLCGENRDKYLYISIGLLALLIGLMVYLWSNRKREFYLKGVVEGAKSIRLESKELIIGRSFSADITISNEMLSKEHLAIKISGNRVIVTDLGSTNGSYIDGKKIEPRESVVLTKGSKLILGSEEVIYVLE
jgi:hypothetical protein